MLFINKKYAVYILKYGLYYFIELFVLLKMNRKKSIGFTGQRVVQIPRQIAEKCRKLPLIDTLFITKMGVYPKALHHYYHRPKGMGQSILIYCTDGRGWIQINDQIIPVKAAEVYIIPSGVPHSYGSDEHAPWTIYWLHLSGKNCDATIKAVMGEPNQPVYVGSGDIRIALFDRIEQAFLNGYSNSNLMFANLTLSFFLSSFITPEYFDQQELPVKQDSYTEKAIKYMQENLALPGNLAVIAASAHLSVSFFSKHFKQETGYSPIEYFNHLKIQRACQLLHSGNLRVNEVARQLGIADQLYFSRLFKKVMGVSPVSYRKIELGLEKSH